MVALKSGEEAPVHGAMRVLTEFSRDLTDQHIPQVAPVILPEMYRIFCEEEVKVKCNTLLILIYTLLILSLPPSFYALCDILGFGLNKK